MIIIFILFTILVLLVVIFRKETNALSDTFTNTDKGLKIVLIGDSMLNNSAYVSANQSVPDLLSKKLVGNTVYNFAKDGATINDCYTQLDKISTELNNSRTYIVVSCGGNNILSSRSLKATDMNNLFNEYSELLKSIKTRVPNASLYVINLYTPTNSHYVSYHKAIDQWNQLLEDNKSSLKYKIINTSSLLVTDEDFTYNIEPSEKGGKKIVEAIVNSLYTF
jgi:lysophospholipase L1-like esterase